MRIFNQSTFVTPKSEVHTKAFSDYITTEISGDVVYQITHRETGNLALIAFDAEYIAKRWFGENPNYFTVRLK